MNELGKGIATCAFCGFAAYCLHISSTLNWYPGAIVAGLVILTLVIWGH